MNNTIVPKPAAKSCATALGEIISRRLAEDERSGRWLAARIDLSNAQLSRVVRGQSNVRLSTFIRICNALKLEASQVMSDLQRLAQTDFTLKEPPARADRARTKSGDDQGRSLDNRPHVVPAAKLLAQASAVGSASLS